MPYKARKAEESDNWEVINEDTEEVRATHEPPDAEEKAKKQAELLNHIDESPDWD